MNRKQPLFPFLPSFLSIIAFLITTNITAQILNPVKWNFKSKALGSHQYELILTAVIDEGWHIYSQHLKGMGPVPTSFHFNQTDAYQLMGAVTEPPAETEYDQNFDMVLKFFNNKVTFTQKVKLLKNGDQTIQGFLEFMVCDNKQCLPPETVDFEFKLHAEDNRSQPGETKKVSETAVAQGLHPEISSSIDKQSDLNAAPNEIRDPVKWVFEGKTTGKDKGIITLTAHIEKGWHIYSMSVPEGEGPVPTSFQFTDASSYELQGRIREEGDLINEYDSAFGMELKYFKNQVRYTQPVHLKEAAAIVRGTLEYMVCNDRECLPPEEIEFEVQIGDQQASVQPEEDEESNHSLWAIFIAGFLGGLLALLTPCVFPMIPLTVSFFTKQSTNKTEGIRNAILYGISIILIYVLLAFGITKIFGSDAMNALSTNVWFNIAFFILFVVFAISFFGAFEIRLPSSWIDRADRASDKGGIVGIFFMAFTLSLVSFSCTGPIIGSLLVEAAVHGGVVGPVTGMFGFSIALALPFALFAAFPGWLQSLPRSGGWLNVVKVSLGFLELAFALKFLSNADLVVQAGLLKREIFLSLWIGIFLLWTLYLLGVFRFPHDSEIKHLSITRVLFAMLTLVFTIYLLPGLWGAPLKIISGFPPPMFYSENPHGFGNSSPASISETSNGDVIGDPEHCPHNLPCFHDYEEGMAYAKKAGKPVMLDFTGWACVNCRKMEENVWSDPKVLKRLRDEVVLISLYVDEKTALPASEQTVKEMGGKTWKINTVGNKWSYMQASVYGTNSQPYYVLIDHDGNMLNKPSAYNPDIALYVKWLDEGINAFKTKQKKGK